jgi:hypothetical protein
VATFLEGRKSVEELAERFLEFTSEEGGVESPKGTVEDEAAHRAEAPEAEVASLVVGVMALILLPHTLKEGCIPLG